MVSGIQRVLFLFCFVVLCVVVYENEREREGVCVSLSRCVCMYLREGREANPRVTVYVGSSNQSAQEQGSRKRGSRI